MIKSCCHMPAGCWILRQVPKVPNVICIEGQMLGSLPYRTRSITGCCSTEVALDHGLCVTRRTSLRHLL